MRNKLVVFDTTHHALWAEEVAKEKGFEVEVVPAPENSNAKCGMALEVLEESYDALTKLLLAEGIPFTNYTALR
ncbi:MAG TPA: DUF3343 domain-containing protein [Longimicrobiales bacterium]|nr:DUF3343 domain-containing protein [Longimicrobiales bacterium]